MTTKQFLKKGRFLKMKNCPNGCSILARRIQTQIARARTHIHTQTLGVNNETDSWNAVNYQQQETDNPRRQ